MNPDAPRTAQEELEIRITALLMGELPPDEAATLQAQIAADPALTALHARLRHAVDLLREARTLPEQPAPTTPLKLSNARREKLLAQFRGIKALPSATTLLAPKPVATKRRRDWRWMVPMGLAASAMFIVGAAICLPVYSKARRIPAAMTGRIQEGTDLEGGMSWDTNSNVTSPSGNRYWDTPRAMTEQESGRIANADSRSGNAYAKLNESVPEVVAQLKKTDSGWASQPGAIRTFSRDASAMPEVHKLFADSSAPSAPAPTGGIASNGYNNGQGRGGASPLYLPSATPESEAMPADPASRFGTTAPTAGTNWAFNGESQAKDGQTALSVAASQLPTGKLQFIPGHPATASLSPRLRSQFGSHSDKNDLYTLAPRIYGGVGSTMTAANNESGLQGLRAPEGPAPVKREPQAADETESSGAVANNLSALDSLSDLSSSIPKETTVRFATGKPARGGVKIAGANTDTLMFDTDGIAAAYDFAIVPPTSGPAGATQPTDAPAPVAALGDLAKDMDVSGALATAGRVTLGQELKTWGDNSSAASAPKQGVELGSIGDRFTAQDGRAADATPPLPTPILATTAPTPTPDKPASVATVTGGVEITGNLDLQRRMKVPNDSWKSSMGGGAGAAIESKAKIAAQKPGTDDLYVRNDESRANGRAWGEGRKDLGEQNEKREPLDHPDSLASMSRLTAPENTVTVLGGKSLGVDKNAVVDAEYTDLSPDNVSAKAPEQNPQRFDIADGGIKHWERKETEADQKQTQWFGRTAGGFAGGPQPAGRPAAVAAQSGSEEAKPSQPTDAPLTFAKGMAYHASPTLDVAGKSDPGAVGMDGEKKDTDHRGLGTVEVSEKLAQIAKADDAAPTPEKGEKLARFRAIAPQEKAVAAQTGPVAFEQLELSTSLADSAKKVPNVTLDDAIDLNPPPEVAEFEGFINNDRPLAKTGNGTLTFAGAARGYGLQSDRNGKDAVRLQTEKGNQDLGFQPAFGGEQKLEENVTVRQLATGTFQLPTIVNGGIGSGLTFIAQPANGAKPEDTIKKDDTKSASPKVPVAELEKGVERQVQLGEQQVREQSEKVEQLQSQMKRIKELKPEQLDEAIRILNVDDPTISHGNILADQLGGMERGLATNLQIQEDKLKTLSEEQNKTREKLAETLTYAGASAINAGTLAKMKAQPAPTIAPMPEEPASTTPAKPAIATPPPAAEPPSPPKAAEPPPVPQPEVATAENAFSTFSLNVSDVSFKLAGVSLEKGTMPDPASVRSEEFINALDYRDPEPAAGAPLAFASERARYPFAHNRDLLRISVKTAAAGRQAGRPLNLVLLLDNSGSMERADRVRILKESLTVLSKQLQPQDKLSIITFSRTPRLWADGVTGDKAAEFTNRVGEITPQGGTDLGAAMDLGYQTALKHYQVGSVNRVVLLTDGAANLGNVDAASLKGKVESHRKQGVAFDCFGVGWEGYNDDLLEQLSRNGDGRYGFINTPEAAATEFAGQLAGALRVAASDVKVQVEFNPKRVTSYRQLGYAKHQLKKEQFRDNTVDAAEIGAAESGNALYTVEVNPRGQGDIATVRVRFKVPGTNDYREHEWTVPFNAPAPALEQSGTSLRLAATSAAFSEWLAQSPFAGDVTTDRLLGMINGIPAIYGADPRPSRLEWMIRQAKSISGR